jgi:hypothetical protein
VIRGRLVMAGSQRQCDTVYGAGNWIVATINLARPSRRARRGGLFW